MSLSKTLEELIGHKVNLSLVLRGVPQDHAGILKEFNKEFIKIEQFDEYGNKSIKIINCLICTLLSVEDLGKKENI